MMHLQCDVRRDARRRAGVLHSMHPMRIIIRNNKYYSVAILAQDELLTIPVPPHKTVLVESP